MTQELYHPIHIFCVSYIIRVTDFFKLTCLLSNNYVSLYKLSANEVIEACSFSSAQVSFLFLVNRHGGDHVGVLQRHNNSFLHHPHRVDSRPVRRHLLPHGYRQAALAEVSVYVYVTNTSTNN